MRDIGEYSVYPSHDGRYVYFTAGTGAYRVDTETLKEEQLVDFGEINLREAGMVADAMGTTALSFDDRFWAIRFSVKGEACLTVIDTNSGEHGIILKRDTIAHLMFCPDDPDLLYYAGPLKDRVWVVKRRWVCKPATLPARPGRMDHARKLDSRNTRTGIRRLEQGHSRYPC